MTTEIAWNRVHDVVDEASRYGTVGVSIIGPSNETFHYLGNRKFIAASTVKIPIMIEVYRRVDAGELDLGTRYLVNDADRTPGSGVLSHLDEGASVTFRDLVYLMIAISDNLATNVLLQTVGIDAVNRTMHSLGMNNSNLGRLMRGRVAEPGETENYATPNEYAAVVRAILDHEVASRQSCAEMINLLGKQQNRRRIARYIPPANTIRWGSKTGENVGIVNDVGFVLAPNGRLIIAAYTEHFADSHVAEQVIGDITRAAMADSGVVGPLYTS